MPDTIKTTGGVLHAKDISSTIAFVNNEKMNYIEIATVLS